jgi:thioesterase domain-containing protein
VIQANGQLLGHSMGAAPILSAAPLLQQKGYTVPGVVVLDVVEGSSQGLTDSRMTLNIRNGCGGFAYHEVDSGETARDLSVGR